jgi:phage FluMu protein Com
MIGSGLAGARWVSSKRNSRNVQSISSGPSLIVKVVCTCKTLNGILINVVKLSQHTTQMHKDQIGHQGDLIGHRSISKNVDLSNAVLLYLYILGVSS